MFEILVEIEKERGGKGRDGRKEGRKKGRKEERRREGRKERGKEGREKEGRKGGRSSSRLAGTESHGKRLHLPSLFQMASPPCLNNNLCACGGGLGPLTWKGPLSHICFTYSQIHMSTPVVCSLPSLLGDTCCRFLRAVPSSPAHSPPPGLHVVWIVDALGSGSQPCPLPRPLFTPSVAFSCLRSSVSRLSALGSHGPTML